MCCQTVHVMMKAIFSFLLFIVVALPSKNFSPVNRVKKLSRTTKPYLPFSFFRFRLAILPQQMNRFSVQSSKLIQSDKNNCSACSRKYHKSDSQLTILYHPHYHVKEWMDMKNGFSRIEEFELAKLILRSPIVTAQNLLISNAHAEIMQTWHQNHSVWRE